MLFRAKFGEQVFELDKFTIGDWRLLKVSFGLDADDLIEANAEGDPDSGRLRLENPQVLAGVLVCCLRRERPNAAVVDLISEVDALDVSEFEIVQAEEDVAESEGPTKAGEPGETRGTSAGRGGSGKSRKKPGARS